MFQKIYHYPILILLSTLAYCIFEQRKFICLTSLYVHAEGDGSWPWLSSTSSSSSSSSSSCSSPSFVKNHDPEEDQTHHQKKSVLSKVKEKARKLRHSLSAKKRHNEDGNTTPSWGVNLDDYEDEEEDAEYLGAPSNIYYSCPHYPPWIFSMNFLPFLFLLEKK